ncbi:hypothetical protein GCM10027286_13700 [Virgibacillus ainsalahensis]
MFFLSKVTFSDVRLKLRYGPKGNKTGLTGFRYQGLGIRILPDSWSYFLEEDVSSIYTNFTQGVLLILIYQR